MTGIEKQMCVDVFAHQAPAAAAAAEAAAVAALRFGLDARGRRGRDAEKEIEREAFREKARLNKACGKTFNTFQTYKGAHCPALNYIIKRRQAR